MLTDCWVITGVEFTNAQRETFEIFGMGMPSSGGATMAMIFNLLEAAMAAGSFSPFAFDPTRTHTPNEVIAVEPATCNLRGAHVRSQALKKSTTALCLR